MAREHHDGTCLAGSCLRGVSGQGDVLRVLAGQRQQSRGASFSRAAHQRLLFCACDTHTLM